MRNRVLRRLRIKTKVSQSEIDTIRDEAKASETLLTSPDFKFLIDFLEQSKQYVLETHAKQSLCDIEEQYSIGDKLRKIFLPASKEYNLLAGEYRFVDKILSKLRNNIIIAQELEKKISDDLVEVTNE